MTSNANSYPKYEYFEENAAVVAAAINGNGMGEEMNANGQTQTDGGAGEGNIAGAGGNPFVAPSYSTERKVVLQPL